MGHQAASVAWLANQLAERGELLKAGWTVFSGGLRAPIPLSVGSAVRELGGELSRKAPASHRQRTHRRLDVRDGVDDRQLDRRCNRAPTGEDRHGDRGFVAVVYIACGRDLRETDDGQRMADVVQIGRASCRERV